MPAEQQSCRILIEGKGFYVPEAELQAAQEREKVLRGWLHGEGWSETNIDGLLLLAAQRTEEPSE